MPTIDVKLILFSTPTLSEDIAPLEPVDHPAGDAEFRFHEDEWSQIEFFPKARLEEVQRLLKEYSRSSKRIAFKPGGARSTSAKSSVSRSSPAPSRCSGSKSCL